MLSWFVVRRHRRRIVREDRQLLEPRVRRFLRDYLSAGEQVKRDYYEAAAGASAGCMPENTIELESADVAKAVAERATAVVRWRQETVNHDDAVQMFVTDAIATVAIAYRRAAGAYVTDTDMQKLGTAAVHLVTIANSHMMARN